MRRRPDRYCPVSDSGVAHQVGGGAGEHHPPAVNAGPRPHVHDVIGRTDGVFVVFDDQHGVAQVPQPQQGFQQAAGVARMKADAGFVQNVQHARQFRSDLGGEPDALALPAGERLGGAVQGQIGKPDAFQKPQAVHDLLEHAAGNLLLPSLQAQLGAELQRPGHGQGTQPREGHFGDHHGAAGGVQLGAPALGAGPEGHEALDVFSDRVGVRFPVAPFQVRQDALERLAESDPARSTVEMIGDGLVPRALEENLPEAGGQVPERGVDGGVVVRGQGLQEIHEMHAAAVGPDRHGAFP